MQSYVEIKSLTYLWPVSEWFITDTSLIVQGLGLCCVTSLLKNTTKGPSRHLILMLTGILDKQTKYFYILVSLLK